ncbi:hypothetical protein HanOQP8_Chr04g0129441 [Helianthus annuus]|nr:hypothetical protein HanOQP8_Chr04g0129441 [Helianthus annuus]
MEQKTPIKAKKVWSLMHAIFLMLKKGITKAKIFTDLNMMIKRSKIVGKSLHNLLFHHHHHWAATTFHRHPHHLPFPTPPPTDDEFSCNTTPLSLFSTHNKNPNNNSITINATVMKALEDMLTSATASPVFGKSPVVKQLRITDSPFPLSNGEDDGKVDEAADKFIMKFYDDLRRQS